METVTKDNLTSDQANRAWAVWGQSLLGSGGLELSISDLLEAKVDERRIEEVLPVLVGYHRRLWVEAQKAASGDAAARRDELLRATAKTLAPIVGKEAVEAWRAKAAVRALALITN